MVTWIGDFALAFVVSYFVVQIGVIIVKGVSGVIAQTRLDRGEGE